MKVQVDRDTCIGSGMCVETCPAVFELVDDKSHVKTDPVPPDQEEAARDAVAGCPVLAITEVE